MSETIQRYGIGVIGGEPYSALGRLVIDLVIAKNGIAVLHADHQREVAALRSECELLRADASWAATHRSELESLRKAFAESEAENATLRAKVQNLDGERRILWAELTDVLSVERVNALSAVVIAARAAEPVAPSSPAPGMATEVPEAIKHLMARPFCGYWTEKELKENTVEAYNIGLRENAELMEQLAEALKSTGSVLDQLSRLGNGSHLGNSKGNCIAIKAFSELQTTLTAYDAHVAAQKEQVK